MVDECHIKRVLKRYRKDSNLADASLEVTRLGLDVLMQACGVLDPKLLSAPRELDKGGLSYLSNQMGIDFDLSHFDYYLHSYVRAESTPRLYSDPSFEPGVPSELGPPPRIPVPEGCRWVSVRPKNGEEAYEAFEIDDAPGEV